MRVKDGLQDKEVAERWLTDNVPLSNFEWEGLSSIIAAIKLGAVGRKCASELAVAKDV